MAGMIKKEDIEKVRARADLYDIVSSSVTLKPSGTGAYVGLCPFHDEKTPSFSVRPAMGVWHCFGCGRGGDVFGYVQERENIDFREAVELLADQYGIELHYESTSNRPEVQGSTRARLLQANEEAQRFFTSQLGTEEALPARQMLGGRNFSQADCEHFGCGYAPRGWDNLVRHLASKGFTHKEMLDAGLARQGQRGVYDYFRGRVTWPIRDSTGRTLGFGARKLYDDDTISAKYINTPDTQLYRKTQVLYGIDLAKPSIVKKRQVVVVEGYTDVMAMHLAGIDTAVATCGTAFGAEHAKIVRRLIRDDSLGAVNLIGPLRVNGQSLSSRIVFTFDGDAAGQKAAIHAFGFDSRFLSQTFVAVAQDNLDPCDLRIHHGDEALRSLIRNAEPLYDFVIETAIGRFDTSYTPGQVGAMHAVAPLIAQIRDRSMYDMYTRKAAGRIGVPVDQMRTLVRSERRRLHVRDEDAYASDRKPYPDSGQNRSVEGQQANNWQVEVRRLMHNAAENQRYYIVDDAVFMTEQQFMATLVQIPRAIDAKQFGELTINSFMTSVFRTLFQAVAVAGGLPDPSMPQGQWLHELTKAGGPVLAGVINELAVMSLPLPPSDADMAASDPNADRSAIELRPASEAEKAFARQLTARLLDLGAMRQIGGLKLRMAHMPEGSEKIQLLGAISELERKRAELKDQIYGNAMAL
ncbi:DNA primase [Bifidobacterium dolichotidis]|uniref:DNA primase n=1 Tax=Bifidobacterium dolichotidis TaxID=2306976 RepID=A0A430FPR0_9BIFI|nr:DNA primase [Bifidobacterium dolichotidis]RSX54827.1 DNA primase [Bifidobacterium dolichotidis]